MATRRQLATSRDMPSAVYLCTAIRDNGMPCVSVLSFLVVGDVGPQPEGGIYEPSPGRKPWCYRCGAKEGGQRFTIREAD